MKTLLLILALAIVACARTVKEFEFDLLDNSSFPDKTEAFTAEGRNGEVIHVLGGLSVGDSGSGSYVSDGERWVSFNSTISGIESATPAVELQNLNVQDSALSRYVFTKQGSGSGNVVQGWAADPITQEVFTLHVTQSPDQAIINRYADGGRRSITSTHFSQTSSTTIGHQQLSMSYDKDGERWFYSSLNESVNDFGGAALRFKIETSGSDNITISEEQVIRLFPSGTGTNNTTPCASLDGRYLVAETSLNNVATVRVFDLASIERGGADDYSDNHLIEFSFPLPNATQPLQSMACDGTFIYVFSGFGIAIDEPLELRVFSMRGELVKFYDDYKIGENISRTHGLGEVNEMEGAGWTWQGGRPYLSVCLASGDDGDRVNTVYALGAEKPTVSYSRGEEPSFISGGDNDYAVPTGEILRIGHYNSNSDQFTETASVRESGRWEFGQNNTGSFTAYLSDSSTPGAGNISATTPINANFTRVGNLIFFNLTFFNVDLSNLNEGNLLIHLENGDAESLFSNLPQEDTVIPFYYNDLTKLDDPLNPTIQFGAILDRSGVLTIREYLNDSQQFIMDRSQAEGADLRFSGSFITQ